MQVFNITAGDQSDRSWNVSLGAISIAIIIYGFFYSENKINDLAFLIGYKVLPALAIWIIFQTCMGRKHGYKKASLSFFMILSILIASDLIAYSQQKNAALQMITEVQKDFLSMMSVDAQRSPLGVTQLDNAPKLKGEFGEVERFTKELMNQAASVGDNYVLELEAIGWNKILDLERVQQDTLLIESRMILRNAKVIVSKYKTQMDIVLENAKKRIDKMNVSETTKLEFKSSWDQGMEDSSSILKIVWDIDASIIAEVENIFTLLSAKKGEWVVQNDQILFSHSNDLSKLTSYITAIHEMEARREAFRTQNILRVNNNFDKLKTEYTN